MTYTVTKTYTKQDDATFWPWENEGYAGHLNNAKNENKLTSVSQEEDGNTVTVTQIWASKSDYTDVMINKNDSDINAFYNTYNTYLALNNISCRIVEEDGTAKVFNPSTKSHELE